jgi:hypothetical protein
VLETIGIVALLRAQWEKGGLPAGYVPLRALASGYGMVLRFAQCRFATMFRSVVFTAFVVLVIVTKYGCEIFFTFV